MKAQTLGAKWKGLAFFGLYDCIYVCCFNHWTRTATCGTCPLEPRKLQHPEGATPNRAYIISPNPQHWASNYLALEANRGGEVKKSCNPSLPDCFLWKFAVVVMRQMYTNGDPPASTSHLLSVSLLPPAAFSTPTAAVIPPWPPALSPASCTSPPSLCPPWHLCPTARPHSSSHPSPARGAEGPLCMRSLGDINPPSPRSHQTKEALTNR